VAQHVDHQLLVRRYFREISRKGLSVFEETTLARLEDEEEKGVITSTSVLDESHQIRRSAIPIEARLAAAYQAIEHFENGTQPGMRSIRLDWSRSETRS